MYRIELLSVPSIRIETVSNFSTSSIRSTYMRVTLIALGLRTYYVPTVCTYTYVCKYVACIVSSIEHEKYSCIVSSIERYALPDMYRSYRIDPVGTLDPDPYF
jgi:hypothetical protein